jgi:hypothetical protein
VTITLAAADPLSWLQGKSAQDRLGVSLLMMVVHLEIKEVIRVILTEPQRNLVLGALVGVVVIAGWTKWKRSLRKSSKTAIKILDPAVVKG